MRKITVVLVALIAATAFGQMSEEEHLEHLRMMLHSMSQHGPVIPQPESVQPTGAVAITITAKSFSFAPATFTVNQGDVVTLTVTVPSNDSASTGHGILMDTYVERGLDCPRGKSASFTFTATTPGTFPFVCTQPSCGSGHTSMIGQMIVKAVAQGPTISSISPNSGPVTGGTTVTISGSGFQSGATVTFGGVPAQVTSVSSSSITAVTPLGPPNEQLTVDVQVTNPDGSMATLHPGFNYAPVALQVTSISPKSGGAGTVVTLTGQGFTSAVKTTITFGGVEAPEFKIDSPISMHVNAPPHAGGTVDITITVGNSTIVTANAFTYPASPPRHRSARH